MEDLIPCEACGKPHGPTVNGRYGYAIYVGKSPDDPTTANFQLCPNCAMTLVYEIAGNLPASYLDVLADVVQRRVALRQEGTS